MKGQGKDGVDRPGCVVNALPKAGTNLLGALLERLGYARRGELSAGMFVGKGLRTLWRRIGSLPWGQGVPVGVDCPVSVSRIYVEQRLEQLRDGSYMTMHVGYGRSALAIVERHSLTPFLMIRDPRAVLNSFVHYLHSEPAHMLNPEFSRLDIADAYRLALHGGWCGALYLEPLDVRCRALAPWRDADSVRTMKFEDLVGPRGGGTRARQRSVIAGVLRTIGIDEIGPGVELEDLDPFARGHTYRRGKIDAWREEMPQEIRREATLELESVLEEWGYE